MAKSTKTSPPRKPVKARGALPSPKSAPQRGNVGWYRRPGWQLVAIVVVIAVIGTIWAAGGAWMAERKETRTNRTAIARFDRSYSALKSPVVEVLSAMPAKTQELSTGAISGPDFVKEADGWLKELRRMDLELRERRIPPEMSELEETRAVLVQGYLVLIDAVKLYGLAARAPDPAVKSAGIQQGNNLLSHGGGVISSGERMLERLKVRFGLVDDEQETTGGEEQPAQPVQIPQEEAPSGTAPAGADPAAAGSAPGAIPGVGGTGGEGNPGPAPPQAP